MILINRNGLRWRDAPKEYGPPKTLYNRWKRWSEMGVFARLFEGLAAEAAEPTTIMMPSQGLLANHCRAADATYLKAHRTASSLRAKKGGRGRLIGRTKGGMNTRLHAVTDTKGRPFRFFISAGQVSDNAGAAALLGGLPAAQWLLADRGYDADWLREAPQDKGIRACVPGRKARKVSVKYDKRRYKRRNRIES